MAKRFGVYQMRALSLYVFTWFIVHLVALLRKNCLQFLFSSLYCPKKDISHTSYDHVYKTGTIVHMRHVFNIFKFVKDDK